MEKVLLAIDGMTPDQKAFRYALSLCKRIKAELGIFQIIRPRYYSEQAKKIRKKASLARKFMEGSMVAVTFAEAGEHETSLDIMSETSKEIRRLLEECEEAGVQCHFSIKSGNPEKEIVRYVNNHRNVVVTIYDDADRDVNKAANVTREKNARRRIGKDLSVPLVTVRN